MIIAQNDSNISYQLLGRALGEYGYDTTILTIGGKEHVEYRHPSGKSWITSTALVTYPFNSAHVTEVSDNKSKGYEVAVQNGVKIPEFVVAGPDIHVHDETIEQMLARHGRLIVKPDASFGSRGVNVNLATTQQVQDAVQKARGVKQQHANVLIQQQVEGCEYRFTVLRGKVVSVMLRETARVVGDGSSTVAELIDREDAARERINRTSMVRYPSLAEIIQNPEYLTSAAVLSKGETLILATSAMISGGTSVYEIVDHVHPSYKQTAEHLANEIQAGFIAVDIFITNPFDTANSHNMYFNEFNRSPALKMVYASRNGAQVDVVQLLAKAIDEYLEQG